MKVRGSQVAGIALAVAVAAWAFTRFGPGDARVIRQKLGTLEDQIAKDDGESNLAGAAKARQIGELLTPQFEIVIVPYSETVTSRQELLRLAMAYRSRSSRVGLAFRDERLEIDPAARTARLDAVAALSGDDQRRESYRVAFDWEKSGGDWLIRRIEVLEVLEGAPFF